MARFSTRELSLIAGIEHELATWSDGGPLAIARIQPSLGELLRLDRVASYGIEEWSDSFRLTFGEFSRVSPLRFRAAMDGAMAGGFRRFAAYDARRPEAWNRNIVLVHDDLERRGATTSTVAAMLPSLGVTIRQQIRVLVCEGASMLGWVGGFREEPYTARDKRLLQHLVPALARSLKLDRLIATSACVRAALDVAMDAIAAPAFLLNAGGVPVHANAAGRQAIDRDPCGTRLALRTAVRAPGRAAGLSLTRVECGGGAPYHLAIGSAPTEMGALSAAAAARWGLSSRQSGVLAWLVRGGTNARIGAELGISDRTVESHVAAIFAKAQVATRSELTAQVLLRCDGRG